MENQTRRTYGAIDGLRAYSTIGIILMHMRASNSYAVDGFVYNELVHSFTNTVFLFMMISVFGMCCGYYEKVSRNSISLERFYKRRFMKIMPFFALMCLVDLVRAPSKTALIEAFTNLTLCFGFLPDAGNITVIGVGWFIGVIFIFYLLFPFFCFVLSNRKRAWFAFACAFVFSAFCAKHFGVERKNFLYCAVYLLAGGMIYLYREPLESISKKYRVPAALVCLALAALQLKVGEQVWMLLPMFAAMLIYALGVERTGVLQNPVTHFLSGISMEMYLCHMAVFRVLQMLKLIQLFESDVLSYLFTSVCTIVGAALFSTVAQWGIGKAEALLRKRLKQAEPVGAS